MPQRQRIYLDNAATSWPKPEAVYQAVDRYLRELGAPAGRSTYEEAAEVERRIASCRRRIAELIGAAESQRIVFTANGTDSLNLALHGLLKPGDHVVTTVVEHNSVLRPLKFLATHRDVSTTYVSCGAEGIVDPDEVAAAITPQTRLIALVHVSNVTGAIQPLAEVAQIAAERNLLLLVDAAQSLGHLSIDVKKLGIHLLAAPGHKGLLGPLGIGVLYVAPGVEQQLDPVRQGGTGTQSESDEQPDSLPDKYEAGNLNVPAILGLEAGMEYLQKCGSEEIARRDRELTPRLLNGLGHTPGVTVFGPKNIERRVGVVSFRIAGYDPREAAVMLDSAYSIQSRAGLHCAPKMHQALGTADSGGTVRLSTGPFTTLDDIDAAVAAVKEIAASAIH